MAYSILEWKTDLSGVLHGTNLDKVQGVFPLANRTARQILSDVDPHETRKITSTANIFYDKVFDYPLPDDLKSNKIIDIRQQANRQESDEPRQTYGMHFDQFKKENDFTIQENNGVKSLRFSKALFPPATLLSTLNGITDNGTWIVGGNATNLTEDTLNFITSSASLRFDISGGGTQAFIENSTLQAVDLTDLVNVGALFVWVYLPSTTIIQNVNLRWGSSAADYYTRTVTTAQTGAFKEGWNLCRFDWSGSAVVGAPIASAIDYARITFAYSGDPVTGVRVDNLVAQIGTVFEIVYYSKYLFTTVDGVKIEKATMDTDTINLDTDSYNLFLKKSAELAVQQVKKQSADLKYFKDDYDNDLKRYKMLYRSEVIKPAMTYYHLPNQRRAIRIYPNQ